MYQKTAVILPFRFLKLSTVVWITFFDFFFVHKPNIFSPNPVEKIDLEISRKKRLFHIFFAYGLLLLNISYPLLCEGEKDWRTT